MVLEYDFGVVAYLPEKVPLLMHVHILPISPLDDEHELVGLA